MQAWLESLPLWAAILFFWAGAVVRTTTIFALGRAAATRGSRRSDRVRELMDTAVYRRAQRLVHRWGVLAVPACFLTVGLQTAVILTTAVTGMPLRRWMPAMLVGTLIWGVIYGTVGMAVVWAWLEQPWVVAPVVVVGLLLLLGHRIRARRRARRERRDEDLPISR
ncbi:DedA family protein [Kocuria sp. CPCC 205263]|uniref:DedA family protein n=1 Tax=Kocuria sp. CPCC 205263 TaxID=3073555 RepID=UPI0034D5DFCE